MWGLMRLAVPEYVGVELKNNEITIDRQKLSASLHIGKTRDIIGSLEIVSTRP